MISCSAPAPRNVSGAVLYSDDFSAENDDWRLGDYQDDDGKVRRKIDGGVYRVGFMVKDPFSWYEIPSSPAVVNFAVQADFRRLRNVYNESHGLVFCSTQAGRYYFLISPFGSFKLGLWDEEKEEWRTVLDWTDHKAIRTEGVNTLRVVRQDGTIDLLANGELLASLEDSQLPAGQAGVGFSFYEVGQELEVEVDNFQISRP